jgi:hypothetical protein
MSISFTVSKLILSRRGESAKSVQGERENSSGSSILVISICM